MSFVHALREHANQLAVVTPGGLSITYEDLAERVEATADRLGAARRLVVVAGTNDLDTLVTYLGCLRGGHPVLLSHAGDLDALVSRYDPDVVIDHTAGAATWDERRAGTAHTLHPELALLLSTSGSTGSPKLVRLSATNLEANASAIAEYLDIRNDDRAVLSLPMQYCYGLSVINSNLLRGAAILLTGDSVVEPRFWDFFQQHGGTSLHGVPHTFELLDRIGFERLDLPTLRYVTQAGGRLAPEAVRRYAALGARDGWRFFVMYGQTEATARMAYLPPELATSRPSAIGKPVPGGRFEIRPADGAEGDGELIYHGPNVMLGYAHQPADLARGRTVVELATGDLARRAPDGLYEVTGRKSRFIKPFGQRIDLDFLERSIQQAGYDAVCTGTDEVLVVTVRARQESGAVRDLVATRLGLPHRSVRVQVIAEFPRLANGKIDYQALLAHEHEEPGRDRTVRAAFTTVLNRRTVSGSDTFVGLGGDSLSYVQMCIALERVLGHLPDDWHLTPIRDLENRRPHIRASVAVETDIVLRALAIILVVGTHVGLFRILGGAHLLLVIAGWNFARFALARGDGTHPGRHVLGSALRIAIPAILWIAWRAMSQPDVVLANVLLINNYLWQGATGYWYIEVLVQLLLVLAAVFSIPAVRRFERDHRFTAALFALAVAIAARMLADDAGGFPERAMTAQGTVWFFALGWLAQRAGTSARKLLVLGAALILVADYFADPRREAVILGGLLLLVLLPSMRLPRNLARTVALLAAASLYIYLTHYAVYPVLLPHLPLVAVVAISLTAGITTWRAVQVLVRLRRRLPL
ncbi:AMP-binding protein [Amycolatopsis thermoflava]|uniref:AMP-binding protein n=1 Tax=Amycolatopsis thermoflava TaxID=84480 RepID=UPI00382E96FE